MLKLLTERLYVIQIDLVLISILTRKLTMSQRNVMPFSFFQFSF